MSFSAQGECCGKAHLGPGFTRRPAWVPAVSQPQLSPAQSLQKTRDLCHIPQAESGLSHHRVLESIFVLEQVKA